MDASELSNRLKDEARRLGFSMVGIITARPGQRIEAYRRWLNNAYHGEMTWLARKDRLIRREDLNVILPGIRSIVCVGSDYWTGDPAPHFLSDPSRGRISNYAWSQDYHKVMEPRLKQLATWLQGQWSTEVDYKVYVDTGAILERDHGDTAGLGFTGKNTMLIQPRRGSWFFLGELLTTAELVPDLIKAPMPTCGRCQRCLTACPTSAFPEPYVLDARRCISYLTIEHKGWIPDELRPLMGNWVYGCDVCQEVCPFNRFAQMTELSSFRAKDVDRMAPPLLELLALGDQQFNERFAGSPIQRIKRPQLVRNACIAAGNWGDEAAVPALRDLLQDPEAIIRGHAAWALGQIDRRGVQSALKGAVRREVDSQVVKEIKAAFLKKGKARL